MRLSVTDRCQAPEPGVRWSCEGPVDTARYSDEEDRAYLQENQGVKKACVWTKSE